MTTQERHRVANFALLLALCWILLAADYAQAPVARASPRHGTSTGPAILPAALVSLEQKMEQLPVNSERYSQTARGAATIVVEQKGKHTKHVSTGKLMPIGPSKLVGEASLSPNESQVFTAGHTRHPNVITIGSTLYSYSARMARHDGGRPWIRFDGSAAVDAFPLHGRSGEVNLGGNGSYAGLINLLATAVGQVGVVGPTTIDGQQTTEFTATVQPLNLIRGLSAKEHEAARMHVPREQLQVFITESGLPLRVVASLGLGPARISQTTDILAINIPVSVQPPPPRQTIGVAELIKLTSRHRIGGQGNARPGPTLTRIGSRLSPHQIEHVLVDPTAPMPSFKGLLRAKLRAVVAFLSALGRH